MYKNEGNIFTAGDLNAKTKTERDCIIDINDKHSPINDIHNYNYDLPLDRNNEDSHPIDTQGQRFLEICRNSRIRILNGIN